MKTKRESTFLKHTDDTKSFPSSLCSWVPGFGGGGGGRRRRKEEGGGEEGGGEEGGEEGGGEEGGGNNNNQRYRSVSYAYQYGVWNVEFVFKNRETNEFMINTEWIIFRAYDSKKERSVKHDNTQSKIFASIDNYNYNFLPQAMNSLLTVSPTKFFSLTWPLKVLIHCPVSVDHNFNSLSVDLRQR